MDRAPETTIRIAAAGACVALGCALLFLLGNTHEPDTYGRSLAGWLYTQWTLPDSRSAHGWLVPCVSLFLVWRRRRELAGAARAAFDPALLIIAPALLAYWAGCRTQQPRLGVLAMIALTWAVPLFLWGRGVARILLFPCAYLLFAVPLGFLNAVTLPLRLIATKSAVGLLNGIGVRTFRAGTAILAGDGSGLKLDVADPCSGLHSLLALTALTAAYAYLTQKTLVRKVLLFACAVPLAMAGNIARIVVICLAARSFGIEVAMRIYHDYSVYVLFIVAILLMTAVGTLLNRIPLRHASEHE